jgi:hypothetical protein
MSKISLANMPGNTFTSSARLEEKHKPRARCGKTALYNSVCSWKKLHPGTRRGSPAEPG